MRHARIPKGTGFPIQLCWKDPNVPLNRGGKWSALLLQGKQRSGGIGKKIYRLSLSFHSLDSVPGQGQALRDFILFYFFLDNICTGKAH